MLAAVDRSTIHGLFRVACQGAEGHVQFSLRGHEMARYWTRMRQRKGQGLVEYALIIGLVTIVIIAALTALSGTTNNLVGNVSNSMP